MKIKILLLAIIAVISLPVWAQSQGGGVSNYQLLNEFRRNKNKAEGDKGKKKAKQSNKENASGKKNGAVTTAADSVMPAPDTRKKVKEPAPATRETPTRGRTRSTGASSYRAAANEGDAEAQFQLGMCYYFGDGVAKDPAAAVEWLTSAARQDHGQAQLWLGKCHLNGEGTEPSASEAAKWLKKAAQKDIAEAQYMLWQLYRDGNGVLQDPTLARQWLEKAAANGSKEAARDLENQ